MSQVVGHISQVIGPVVDVYFEGSENEQFLPAIHDALEIKRRDGKRLIVEVQQHIGENTVRTVAMDSTDGLQRNMKVRPLGGPITMPVGDQIKGRLMNVVGDSIDGMKELNRERQRFVGPERLFRKISYGTPFAVVQLREKFRYRRRRRVLGAGQILSFGLHVGECEGRSGSGIAGNCEQSGQQAEEYNHAMKHMK